MSGVTVRFTPFSWAQRWVHFLTWAQGSLVLLPGLVEESLMNAKLVIPHMDSSSWASLMSLKRAGVPEQIHGCPCKHQGLSRAFTPPRPGIVAPLNAGMSRLFLRVPPLLRGFQAKFRVQPIFCRCRNKRYSHMVAGSGPLQLTSSLSDVWRNAPPPRELGPTASDPLPQ